MITGQKVAKKKLVRSSLDNLSFSLTLCQKSTVNSNHLIIIYQNRSFRNYSIWLSGNFFKKFHQSSQKFVKMQKSIWLWQRRHALNWIVYKNLRFDSWVFFMSWAMDFVYNHLVPARPTAFHHSMILDQAELVVVYRKNHKKQLFRLIKRSMSK